jgi:hypothetical protein
MHTEFRMEILKVRDHSDAQSVEGVLKKYGYRVWMWIGFVWLRGQTW